MSFWPTNFHDWTECATAIVTAVGLIAAGSWAFFRYIIQGDRFAHIESGAEISLIGVQDGHWIVELKAILTNRGKVEHKIDRFSFELSGLSQDDPVVPSAAWGGQVDFPNLLALGQFLPNHMNYFVIGPSVTAKYSHIALIPMDTTFLLMHCTFDYVDRPDMTHAMEASVKVPPTV